MAVAVSILVLVALIVIAWALVVLFRRLLSPDADDGVTETPPPRPYGGLTEPGPVGELGQLSPDADLAQTGTDSEDIYGE